MYAAMIDVKYALLSISNGKNRNNVMKVCEMIRIHFFQFSSLAMTVNQHDECT